jgi:hypothetical protein
MTLKILTKFRGGAERQTTGILMWSKLYTLYDKNNQEVVVALMDTQVLTHSYEVMSIQIKREKFIFC